MRCYICSTHKKVKVFREIISIYCGSHAKYINRFSEKRRIESHEGQEQIINTVRVLLEMLTASGMMQKVYCYHSYYCQKTTISGIKVPVIFIPKIFRYRLGHFLVLGLRNFQAEASLLRNDCHSGVTEEKEQVTSVNRTSNLANLLPLPPHVQRR